jgi:RNA polymerase sigma factor (sigma-70 family)
VDDPHERFADLYDRYYRNILRYALQNAHWDSAEDVASEVFLIAWRQLPEVPEPPLPWLLGVARNLLRQHAGADRRRQRLADRIAALTSAADMTAGDAGERVVDRASALAVLASLPGRDIEALTLVSWHGLDVREAAAAAGCSPRAFTVRLHRARRRLASALRSADHERKLPAPSLTAGTTRRAAPFCPPSISNPMEKA